MNIMTIEANGDRKLDIGQLKELLLVLRANQVRSFSFFGLHIHLREEESVPVAPLSPYERLLEGNE